jgi:hypothetical protein
MAFAEEDGQRLRDILKKLVRVSELLEDREIEIVPHPAQGEGWSTMVFKDTRELVALGPLRTPVAEFFAEAYEDLLWAVDKASELRGLLATLRGLSS